MNRRLLLLVSGILFACTGNGQDPLRTVSSAVKPPDSGGGGGGGGGGQGAKGVTWNDPSGALVPVIQSSIGASPNDPTLYVADTQGNVWLTTAATGTPQPVTTTQTYWTGANCTGTSYVVAPTTPRLVFAAPLGGNVVTLDSGPCNTTDADPGTCCLLPDGGEVRTDGGCTIGNIGYFTMPDVPPTATVALQSIDDGIQCVSSSTTLTGVPVASLVTVSMPASLFAAPAHPEHN